MVVIPKTLSDHPSLIGVVRFPNCQITEDEVKIPLITKKETGEFQNMRQPVQMATNINPVVTSVSYGSIPKSKITDFYPYTYYVLTDGECEPLIMQPQFMPSNVLINGSFALSHSPIEKYWCVGYKGDDVGRVYNITNVNQMMLPTATNEGLNYLNANANSIAQTRKNQISENVLVGGSGLMSTIETGGMAIATGGMSLLGGGLSNISNSVNNKVRGQNQLKQIDSRNKDVLMTPSSISSFGTPSTRKAFATDNVRILKYQVSDKIKDKIENYVKRYGNKYNNYATINHKTYKGYIKMVDIDITSGIDNNHLLKIKSIFEGGVYIE